MVLLFIYPYYNNSDGVFGGIPGNFQFLNLKKIVPM